MQLIRALYRKWLEWKYRKHDPELCCCGEMIGDGGSICAHGGCRSAVEWCVTSQVDKLFPILRGEDDAAV